MIKIKVFLLLAMLSMLNSYGQDLNSFLNLSNSYYNLFPIEKVHLHTDKSSYTADETIRIKAYLTIGTENHLSGMSKILHVDLLDAHDKLIAHTNVALVNGLGISDIPLIDSLAEGVYRLRAYTRWMRNFDHQYFFDRYILVSNARTDAVSSSTTIKNDREIEVKLTDLNGLPLNNKPIKFELVSDNKVVEKKEVARIKNGEANISFKNSLKANDIIRYKIINQEAYDIEKNIHIHALEKSYNVNLVPEGGKLILGHPRVIGIKVTDEKSLGKKAKFHVINDSDTVISTVTNDLGYGKFVWKPVQSEEIFGLAIFEDRSQVKVELPKIYANGYSLHIREITESVLRASLYISSDLLSTKSILAVLHAQGKIYSHQQLSADNINIPIEFKLKDIPNGIITLSILNGEFEPIAERAFFNVPKRIPNKLVVTTDKNVYKTREKVNVTLNWADESTKSSIAALSSSVVHIDRIDFLESYQAPTIFSSFMLNTDLENFIEKPNYYFSGDSVKKEELDLLVLTHGFRKFNWEQLDTNQIMNYYQAQGIEIKGRVTKAGRTVGEKDARVKLVLKDKRDEQRLRISDEQGDFIFENILYPNGTGYLINVVAKNPKTRVNLTLDSIHNAATITKSRNQPLLINDVNRLLQKELNLNKEFFTALERAGILSKINYIDEVVVNARQNKISRRSKNLNGPGQADYVLDTKDLEEYNSIESAVLPLIKVFDSFEWPETLAIFVDGFYLDYMLGRDLPISNVESVEVITSKIFTSLYEGVVPADKFSHVIVITSKEGYNPYSYIRFENESIFHLPQGIHVNQPFFKPEYDANYDRMKFTDLRTLIHWESSIVLGKSGNASFDFYTGDITGTYELTIEGLDLNGGLIHQKIYISVSDN